MGEGVTNLDANSARLVDGFDRACGVRLRAKAVQDARQHLSHDRGSVRSARAEEKKDEAEHRELDLCRATIEGCNGGDDK